LRKFVSPLFFDKCIEHSNLLGCFRKEIQAHSVKCVYRLLTHCEMSGSHFFENEDAFSGLAPRNLEEVYRR
jgi:hypothetical protein